MNKKKFIWIFISIFPLLTFSQEKASFSIEFNDELVSRVLLSLENTFDVRFSYQDIFVINKRITLKKEQRTLDVVLEEISSLIHVNFEKINERYIIISSYSSLDNIQILSDVIIRGYLSKGITKHKDATFHIKPKKLEILPGLTEADVLESIQLLPGVISPNETATGFTVRGGATDQNRIIWDGINMYHKGHLFGMLSPFNPNITQEVVFYNKGTHPRFGERVSSVIDISSNSEFSKTFKAGLGINGINADAYIESPVIQDKLSIQAAIRRSYSEALGSFTFDELAHKVFQNTKITNAKNTTNDFYFVDFNIKLNYKLNEKNNFSLSTIYIDNNLDYLVTDTDSNRSFNDLLSIRNEGYSLSWTNKWNDIINQKTQAYISKYRLTYDFITSENSKRVSIFEKQNVIFDSGISSEVTINTTTNNNVTVGYQYVLKDVSYAFFDTSDLSFVLDADKTVINTHSLYVHTLLRNTKIFDIYLGLRTNYYQELNTFKIEPRILVYKEIVKNLNFQFSGELKSQIISEIDETVLSDLSLENKLWRLANGETFPIIGSRQVSLGFLYTNKGWSFDIDSYYKKIEGITALSLGFLNPDDSSFHIGEQNIIGIDFYAEKDINSIKTWLSYSYSNVESKFDGINNDDQFRASTNIKHAVTSSIAYKINQFQLALAWHWRTGKPYTKALFSPDDESIFFEKINTEQLSNYHRMDFSSTYEFKFSKKNDLKGKIGFSIRNVYNQKNHISREYKGNNNLNDPIVVVDKYSLGFTPNFLLRAYW